MEDLLLVGVAFVLFVLFAPRSFASALRHDAPVPEQPVSALR